MSGYATLDATQKTSRKTSKNGKLFVSEGGLLQRFYDLLIFHI
jgi:hypothetical protein